jgi:hypothetical protein
MRESGFLVVIEVDKPAFVADQKPLRGAISAPEFAAACRATYQPN